MQQQPAAALIFAAAYPKDAAYSLLRSVRRIVDGGQRFRVCTDNVTFTNSTVSSWQLQAGLQCLQVSQVIGQHCTPSMHQQRLKGWQAGGEDCERPTSHSTRLPHCRDDWGAQTMRKSD